MNLNDSQASRYYLVHGFPAIILSWHLFFAWTHGILICVQTTLELWVHSFHPIWKVLNIIYANVFYPFQICQRLKRMFYWFLKLSLSLCISPSQHLTMKILVESAPLNCSLSLQLNSTYCWACLFSPCNFTVWILSPGRKQQHSQLSPHLFSFSQW